MRWSCPFLPSGICPGLDAYPSTSPAPILAKYSPCSCTQASSQESSPIPHPSITRAPFHGEQLSHLHTLGQASANEGASAWSLTVPPASTPKLEQPQQRPPWACSSLCGCCPSHHLHGPASCPPGPLIFPAAQQPPEPLSPVAAPPSTAGACSALCPGCLFLPPAWSPALLASCPFSPALVTVCCHPELTGRDGGALLLLPEATPVAEFSEYH